MSAEDFIAEAELRLGVALPDPLRMIYRAGDGRFREDGQWWVIWPLDRVVAENHRVWHEGLLPRRLLAFGDDGTGDPFCVTLDHDSEEVLRWSWIDDAPHSPEGRLAAFIGKWVTDT